MKVRIVIQFLMLALIAFLTSSAQTIEDVKSSIIFIYLPNAKGDLQPNGTGFFIGVDDTVHGGAYVYIVTSKHVLWDTSTKSFVPNGWLRLNRKGGDATFVRMPMRTTGSGKNVFIHPDSTVDLVVIQGIPDQEKYDFGFLPYALIRNTKEIKKLGLGEGTDVFFPALFVPHTGEHKNYPIIRFGKLAMMSDERISWDGQLQRLFLIESISVGGNSGAPVFLWFDPRMKPGELLSYDEKRIRLVGVMQGYFELQRAIGFRKTQITPIYGSHTGISAVVPVDFLQDILSAPEVAISR